MHSSICTLTVIIILIVNFTNCNLFQIQNRMNSLINFQCTDTFLYNKHKEDESVFSVIG